MDQHIARQRIGEHEKSMFVAAREIAPEDRAAFLRGLCPDPELRARIELLIRYHEGTPEIDDALLVGEFRLLEQIGEGAMGVVHRAEDTVLGRTVAIKTMAVSLEPNEENVARFYHEARIAARLSHPGVVQIHQFDVDRGTHYIAMEFVKGRTLKAWMQHELDTSSPANDGTPLDPDDHRDVAKIIEQVATALDYIHQQSPPVIHLDIKPSNILLGNDGRARITDFGIARAGILERSENATELGGSLHYMSPERLDPGLAPVDQRADVYSLGVVLYQLLTGTLPFKGSTQLQLWDAQRNQHVFPVRTLNPKVPRDLAVVCHKALEYHVDDRYPTAIQCAADLRCVLENRPILAQPPGLARRLQRWTRQNRAVIAVAAAVAALSIASVSMWSQERMRRQQLGWIRIVASADDVEYKLQTNINDALTEVNTWRSGNDELQFVPTGPARLIVTHPIHGALEFDRWVDAGPENQWTLDVDWTRGSTRQTDDMLHIDGRTIQYEGRPLTLAPFLIDRTEVSNGKYLEFLVATGRTKPEHWDELDQDDRDDQWSRQPVVGISHRDATAYAEWCGKRLPTAAEWEHAANIARGAVAAAGEVVDSRARAYRNPSDESLRIANSGGASAIHESHRRHTLDVNDDPIIKRNNAPLHMLGNVREFTSTIDDGPTRAVILMGRGWLDAPGASGADDAEPSWTYPLDACSLMTGFRCALSRNAVPRKGNPDP